MGLTTETRELISNPGGSRLGLGAVGLLVALSAYAVSAGLWKLLGISWAAFAAMAGAAALGGRTRGESPTVLVWGYGLASGAMITSAAVFLLPSAIGHHAQFGGFGVALGVLVGFGSHSIGHRLAHLDMPLDRTVAELSAHALAAGVVIGVVYGNMPDLGLLLGLSIVSHKGPAGYAAASRLARDGGNVSAILLPSVGVGLTAITAASLQLPTNPALRGIVFGFATGIFLHVAMDFLPRCELGSEVHDALSVDGDAHALLDRLRLHAVASTVLGGLVVFVAWLTLA
ncbi:ZIP family metal transporter [Salinigranum halophilum]|uniref:ZIP family metal transporter n=1 Tax=Salinigranum halophilum TaxID=2565931 RepID=UPI0010A8D863|nr:ZIP family metal transporter [Salinigranum halophilum]